ncbi:titin homolog [Uranotaenia lowii]|uniref:titin homolog n=1 Tax=Uranotaenia lowii TaxID=190385 RepID=UPI00247AFB63|nr:titin homolog [Uranotaenia lowii]
MKSEQPSYADLFRELRAEPKLTTLDESVTKTRRTLQDELLFELQKKTRRGARESTLQHTWNEQESVAIKLREAYGEMQIATIRLSPTAVNTLQTVGSVRVGRCNAAPIAGILVIYPEAATDLTGHEAVEDALKRDTSLKNAKISQSRRMAMPTQLVAWTARQIGKQQQDRSKQALEKLQIRKDYENLKVELDKLVRAESKVKTSEGGPKPPPTETQKRQRAETRQSRMNEAVEDLLKQRVLITCPVVRGRPTTARQEAARATARAAEINVAGATSAAAGFLDTDLRDSNSSDSFSTILLGYDPATGIERPRIPLPAGKDESKISKYKELLEQLNVQKALLLDELKKEEEIEQELLRQPEVTKKGSKQKSDDGIQKLKQRQLELEEQQKKLHEKEREIFELEKQLKEKLERLDKNKAKPKIPKFHIEAKGSIDAEVKTVPDTDSNESLQSGTDIPVKIVIVVNEKSEKKAKKTPKKPAPQERKRKAVKEAPEKVPISDPDPVPIPALIKASKPVVKPKDIQPQEITVQQNLDQSPISSTTSTVYRQLPSRIDNRVGNFLNQLEQKSYQEPALTQQRQSTSKVKSAAPKHRLEKLKTPTPQPQSQELNPALMQYIIRLLGMSRQSIDQLGVSSSTSVSTPHDSVLNVAGNQSTPSDEISVENQSRMDRLRRFINQNYDFLNEIDETLKEHQLSGTVDENISRVEDVWMKTLTRKEQQSTPKTKEPQRAPVQIGQSPPVKDTSLKSILKSPKKPSPKLAKIITPQGHIEVINLSDREEQEVLEKYAQMAEGCNKRITELSEMIRKVREEKKKLIENSISSSEPQESTKYMDLPGTKPPTNTQLTARTSQQPADETSPRSARDDPVSEELRGIFTASSAQQRQIGLSKDSGIAMSRPVTSSDFRDSPDVAASTSQQAHTRPAQFVESSEDLSSAREAPMAEEPAFEPLLKDIPKVKPLDSQRPDLPQVKDLPANHKQQRTKPPVAITRYSPQLDQPTTAHELSTILEVETPAASKINVSIPNESGTVAAAIADSEPIDPAEQLLIEARDKLLEHARALGYEGFPNYEEYIQRENLEDTRYDLERTNLSRLNELLNMTGSSDILKYRKYSAPAPEMNITEDTSKEGESVDNKRKPQACSNSSSSASLPDVIAELKLRNLVDKSFNIYVDDSNRSTPDSGSLEIIQPVPIVERPSSRKGNDHSDATESLERDLQKLGLRWASSMLKKNQEVLRDQSSSSSLSATVERRSNTRNTKLNDQNESGAPLNLKQFIARELMIRTQTDLNSLSDSSSPGSFLLRSLLDISNINTSTPELLTHTTTDKNVQRTSTPVATKSSISTPRDQRGGPSNGVGGGRDTGANATLDGTGGLFSGESRISSVHLSSGSSGGENKLSAPNVRLDVERFKQG